MAQPDLSQPRETGSQKAELTCPRCGGQVPLVESAYGSISPGACPNCWPADASSQMEAQVAAAQDEDGVPREPASEDAGGEQG